MSDLMKPEFAEDLIPARNPYEEIAPASAAAAAAAKAEIEAAYVAASYRPRNEMQFRNRILTECKDPGFAEIALYHKPVGGGKHATNFSIRFMETALKYFRNIRSVARITHSDQNYLLLYVGVTDLEDNVGHSAEAHLPKTIERKEAKGRTIRGDRLNSNGERVLIVEATPDELRNQIGSERSKLLRDQGQRLLPRNVLNECRALIDATLRDKDAQDPKAALKRILDSFAAINVTPDQLAAYLEHPIEHITAKDLTDLRAIYTGIRDGDYSWAELVRTKAAPADPDPVEPKSGTLREQILAQRKPPKTEEPKP